jgi:hypothetical protein
MEIEEGNAEADELNLGFWLIQKEIIVFPRHIESL